MVDAGGLLQVGPHSAGASPGPACYGLGGTQPTVTDANLILGRLVPSAFLGGGMTLNIDAARAAVKPLADVLEIGIEETAAGIIRIANEHMARALRVISVARGHDPRNFRLCCFGGAGGLHICALADAMGMVEAMVPIHGGVLSAMGMLMAPVQRQLSQTHQAHLATIAPQELESIFKTLTDEGMQAIEKEGFSSKDCYAEQSLDLRYEGQSATLNIPFRDIEQVSREFHKEHEQRYGHRLKVPVELVNIRVGVTENKVMPAISRLEPGNGSVSTDASQPLYGLDTEAALIQRETLRAGDEFNGPALVLETNATTWLEPAWTARCDEFGNLILKKNSAA